MTIMPRSPEPEHMTEEEETCYAKADYSTPHEALAREIVAVAGLGRKMAIDIGCGPGDVLLRLRRQAPDWTLFGGDISTQMLTLAQQDEALRLNKDDRPINWVLTNGRRFGFDDGSFDIIISNSVLHHVVDTMMFWREMRRIASTGAYVFVRDLRRPRDPEHARALVECNVGQESEVVKQHYYSSLLSAYTCDEVKEQLREAKITCLDVRELEDRYLSVEGRWLAP